VERKAAADAVGGAHVALVAWMPMATDFTADFRKADSLREYLVIGEAWDGCCGDNWRTWGNPAFAEGDSSAPPYERDGFEKKELAHLSALQLSRYDCAAFAGSSKTFSFARRGLRTSARSMATWSLRSCELRLPSASPAARAMPRREAA